MTKLVAVIIVIALISLSTCATTGSGTGGLSLQDAIEQTGEKIANELPKGSRVAIVAFESENDNLSDYIMEELTGALFDQGIEVADRQNLEYVYKELNLQMSGDVSDESAKSIGKFLAADMVITGQLLDLDGVYRYRTSTINVETAVRASVTRLNVRSDNETRRMITALANQQTSVKAAKYGVSENSTLQTAGTFLDRGILFASRGEFALAIADFDEAIRLNPNLAAAYILRGRALKASASYYVIEIRENFSGMETVSTGGRISGEQKRILEQALADYTQALRLDPHNAVLYTGRGDVYDDLGEFDKAIADYNQALKLKPDYAAAYRDLGTAYSNKGDYDRAIADFNQAIRLDPNFAMAYSSRGTAYSNKGDYDRAIADFNQAIRLDPNFAVAYSNRGTAYSNKGDYDRAIADFNQAIRLDPNFAVAYVERGTAYWWKNDLNRAITDYEASLRLDPNNADARRNLEEVRRQRGR